MITQKGISVPPDLAEALEADAPALGAFEAQRPSCQRRSVTWIEDARKPETRKRRVQRAIEMALDWKRRHDRPRVAKAAL